MRNEAEEAAHNLLAIATHVVPGNQETSMEIEESVVGRSSFLGRDIVEIPSSPQDIKPIITNLLMLNPPQPLNSTTNYLQQQNPQILEASLALAPHVKAMLVTQLTTSKTKEVKVMIHNANTCFAYLDSLGVNYMPFYKAVHAFISYHFDRQTAELDKLTNISAYQLKTRYAEVATYAKEAGEFHLRAENDLSNANQRLPKLRKGILEIREILRKMEEELPKVETEVRTCEAEKARWARAYREAEEELKSIAPGIDEAEATVRDIEQRLDAASAGIHQMTELISNC